MTKMFTVLKIATPWVGRSKSTSCGAHAWCFEWCFWKNSSNRLTSKISKGLPLYWTIDHSHFFLAWSGHSLAIFLAGTRELDTMGRRPAKCYRYNKNLSLEGLGRRGSRSFSSEPKCPYGHGTYWTEPNFLGILEALDRSWISNHWFS